jgi:hypothetical protein
MLCWVSREYVMRRWLLRGNGAVCGLAFLVALTFVVVGSATASAETWSPQEPPSPTSATESYLNSVSCTSSEECIAVGWFESLVSETETAVPLAEKWNGTAWSAQEPPAPAGAKESDLYGVSCASSTECTAVGEFDDSSNEGVPLAEKWNGTAWSAQEPPAPTGGKESALYGVSCASSTECTAVGDFYNSANKYVPLAEKWNGTGWSAQEPPAATGAVRSHLYGVSCTSSIACTAVGEFTKSSGKVLPLAEKWNGTTWSAQEPPAPTGAKQSILHSVSCTSSTACVAAGTFENSSEKFVPLAEKWNGTAWTVQEPSIPTGAKQSDLYGVSCTSSTACTAAGEFLDSSEKFVPLAEKWNGTAWTVQEPPSPSGAEEARLSSVSCTSSTECTAGGYFQSGLFVYLPLAEHL